MGVGGPEQEQDREILREKRGEREGKGEARQEGSRQETSSEMLQVNSLGTVCLFWGSYIHLYYLYMCGPINKGNKSINGSGLCATVCALVRAQGLGRSGRL